MQTTSSHDPMHTLYYFAGNGTDRGSAMALHGSRWCLWCLSVGSFGPLGFKRMQESLATQLRWGSHLLMPRLRNHSCLVCVYVCVCVRMRMSRLSSCREWATANNNRCKPLSKQSPSRRFHSASGVRCGFAKALATRCCHRLLCRMHLMRSMRLKMKTTCEI